MCIFTVKKELAKYKMSPQREWQMPLYCYTVFKGVAYYISFKFNAELQKRT